MDIFPTICDLVQVKTPATVEGKSLAPALADSNAVIRDSLYLAYTDMIRGVQQEHYKLIEYIYDGQRKTQLFDTAADPSEIRNLADDPAQVETLIRLRRLLQSYADSWDDRAHPMGQTYWTQLNKLDSGNLK